MTFQSLFILHLLLLTNYGYQISQKDMRLQRSLLRCFTTKKLNKIDRCHSNLSMRIIIFLLNFFSKTTSVRSEVIEKIIKHLPHLEVINIKGGEPFADPTNFRILEELVKVNKDCRIEIISNVPDSEVKQALNALIDYVIERKK